MSRAKKFLNTEIINISTNFRYAINQSKEMLINGNVISLPTETVYGLACDIFNQSAIQNIFELKGRNYSKPLSAFCYSIEQVEQITSILPDLFYILFENFLPGPLTIIVNKNQKTTDLMTSGMKTIAIRVPQNLFVLELLNKFSNPLASTSANISDGSSCTNAIQVNNIFNSKIPLIIDGNESKFGIESTILDISNPEIRILREGVIKKEIIENFIGKKIGF